MYDLVIVLLTLNGALVCDAFIIKDYNQNQPTSYVTREDEPGRGKKIGYGFSKKSGYNKMIVTTYLSPVPEEVAASYSAYVIHPVDNKRCDYNQPRTEVYQSNAPIPGFLKMFPIIVADAEEQPKEEPTNEFRVIVPDDNTIEDDESVKAWYFKEEPQDENIIWLLKQEPKMTTAGYWRSFKKQFDTFYKDEFDELFGDIIDEEDGNEEVKEDGDEYFWDNDDYLYEDDHGKPKKMEDLYGPKFGPGNRYQFNDYDYGYEWSRKW